MKVQFLEAEPNPELALERDANRLREPGRSKEVDRLLKVRAVDVVVNRASSGDIATARAKVARIEKVESFEEE